MGTVPVEPLVLAIGSLVARRGRLMSKKGSFIADQRGAVALEGPAVYFFMIISLLLPLADVAVAGFKYISAHQALRAMGQRTQFSPPTDVTTPAGIDTWKSSLPTT